ncbi:MAG: response regulator transcription factor [Chloroflexota bacterium]|jgi:DNA-binding NarL/FixJ family response regulator
MPVDTRQKKNSRKCSVYLVDDNPTFLRTTINFLSRDKRISVVGTATNAGAAILEVGELKPNIILLDLAMPDMNGFEAIPHLHTTAGQAKIIILTLFDSENDRRVALSAGADYFIPKTEMLTELMPAIWKAACPNKDRKIPRRRKPHPGTLT